MSENWQQSEICIVINDKSQGTTAKHCSCDRLFHYKFITQPAGEKFFKSDEQLAKLQAKWLIVLYTPFALGFQRSRTRQISKITCVLWTQTVNNCCVKRQINVSLLSTNIKLL